MRKTLIILLSIPLIANAGVKKLTWTSRANCGNNESISWHLGHSYNLRTETYHLHCKSKNCERDPVDTRLKHKFEHSWEKTWRSAAVHWGEALPGSGWWVYGHHYIRNDRKEAKLLGITYADNCNIYDGWWDH